jgi:flagellar motor component MotA
MSTRKTQVTNLGEAISVLVQVANLSQKSGILSLEDAVVVKSAIDFIDEMNSQDSGKENSEGPQ